MIEVESGADSMVHDLIIELGIARSAPHRLLRSGRVGATKQVDSSYFLGGP